jgi:phospholipid transport system substrate-binding protein
MGLPALAAIVSLALTALPVSTPISAITPQTQTEQLVATLSALQDVKVPEADRTAVQAAAALEGFFDFDALAQAAIAPHKAAFKPKQLTQVTQTFRQLVVILTSKSGAQLNSGRVTIARARAMGATCAVDVAVSQPDDDVPAHVDFIWSKRKQGWRVIDVALDGASIVKDYQNQFGRILKKDGAEALLSKLKERLALAQKSAS